MALTVNPDCTLWKEITDKEQRAFAFKMLNLRRAASNPALATAGSLAVDKRKFMHWRSSLTAQPAPGFAPNVTKEDWARQTGKMSSSVNSSAGFNDRLGSTAGSTVYATLRAKPFLASWGDRAAPPGGPDFKQSRR
eukprot:gb/GFBE01013370.1/.p1 GENE.gb/GFBE01013370.1/~~gb/GFBE01013370.1/.p1  ORF type:complete len:136 (+),score=19.18 gb/GFBE01013370.1/:1-408(+)